MQNRPLFTVITVVYNSESSIFETINSVFEQDCEQVEYIVIDGGSTDGTVSFLKENDDKIDYWISEPDRGIYDAMNKGVKLANGEWINFMNAGDLFYSEDTLSNVSLYLEGDVTYGSFAVKGRVPEVIEPKGNFTPFSNRNIPYCHQALFVRSSLLKEAPFDTKYSIAADYDQYLRFLAKGVIIKRMPLVVAYYLGGGISETNKKQAATEYHSIMRKYWPLASSLIYCFRMIRLYFK